MDSPQEGAERRTADWTPVPRSRAHELVIDAIEEQVAAGRLVVGDSLPPEREFAARLGVSRAGVREAIRVLEGYGVLESRVGAGRGSGTFIAALPSEALTRLLRFHIGLSNFPVEDVQETRIALERASAGLAAQNSSDEDRQQMLSAIETMENDGGSVETFNDADTAFHVAIAEAAGNRLLADMTVAIRASRRSPLLTAIHSTQGWEQVREELIEQHRGIFDAISAGQSHQATELIEEHIRFAFAHLTI